MNNTTLNTVKEELTQHIIDYIGDYEGTEASELHNNLFNTDYYIIGYYQAEEWLKEGPGIFNAIDEIKEYEQDNFGEVTTDLSSSENVCNMFVYIAGEEILSESETLTSEAWDGELTAEYIEQIKEELKETI